MNVRELREANKRVVNNLPGLVFTSRFKRPRFMSRYRFCGGDKAYEGTV
jgi:hypothetical protein